MLAAITLALASAPAASTQLIYLDCTIMQRGRPNEWKVTLNEGEGVVDYDGPISGPQRQPARFTADSVYFIGFTLSRVNLSIQRTNDVFGVITYDIGTCRLPQPKKRAF